MIHIPYLCFCSFVVAVEEEEGKEQKRRQKEAIKNNFNTFSGESSVHQITARLMFAKASGQTIRKTR